MSRRLTPGALAALALVAAMAAPARDAAAPAWPDTVLARTQARSLLQSLNADLLSHPSATLTLERWCSVHGMALPARIVARRIHGADKPLPADLRDALALAPHERVKYRRVQLMCGDHVLSEADNWYRPQRLTAAMNHTLDTTDAPFGKVVRPLHFRRETLSAVLLWPSQPAGREARDLPAGPHGALEIPHRVLQHRAVLYDAQGRPFSALIETYTGQVLAFPAPSAHSD